MTFSVAAVCSIALIVSAEGPAAPPLPVGVDHPTALDALLRDDLYGALELPRPGTPLKRTYPFVFAASGG